MASSSTSPFLFFLTTSLLLLSATSSYQFTVGGPTGWVVPTIRQESGSYNYWSIRTVFHVGDSLYFKYENDSVLVVTRDDYKECNTSNPINKFVDGETVYRFDRLGFFYFVSGEPGHCLAGQRMIVLVRSETTSSPFRAPASSPEGFAFESGPALSPRSSSNSGSGSPGQTRSNAGVMIGKGYCDLVVFVCLLIISIVLVLIDLSRLDLWF